ncbi:MAG: hypothetical protein NZ954_07925 [Thermofilaceae archaeon]|nr:hypothetical protein [Thermofilaceae archaeon]MDW8004382.1 hypothetical protein [Thermofilaceae archaeon]
MKRSYRSLPSKGEAALIALNLLLMPPTLWASSQLLRAASFLLYKRMYPLATVTIFVNNMAASSLVALASLTSTKLAWAWGLKKDYFTKYSGRIAVLLSTTIFALSFILRRNVVNPLLLLLPHFWLEYSSVTLAAYSGFKGKPLILLLSASLLVAAALTEVYVAYVVRG